MTDWDDIALLRAFAATEAEAAFAVLVGRHINSVYSAALRRVGNTHAAEEITQAVFTILARKAKSLGANTILAGWLHQTTRLTAANFLRGETRRQQREQEAYMQSSLNMPEENVWSQIAPLLDDALDKLDERDRNAVMLRFFENKSLAEVGTALGASEDAAKMRVNRALDKLRKVFSKRGVTLSVTLIAGAVAANSVQAAPVGLALAVTAAAKGAAGGSTLALVNGTLKALVWAKAKMALMTGVAVLLVAGTTLVVVKEALDHFEANKPVWNDDRKALEAAPPMAILRRTIFPASRAGGILQPENGKLAKRHQPAGMLLTQAYSWSRSRMVLDAPLPGGFFDCLVTLPTAQNEALQNKIREQLHITGRRETRATAVYILRGKPKPELQPVSNESVAPLVENGHYKGRLWDLVDSLEGYLETPVLCQIDSTTDGLVDLHWGNPTATNVPKAPDVPALQKAVFEQLGLEMIATNCPIEMLVIEKAN